MTIAPGHNGYDGKQLEGFLREIDVRDDRLLTLKSDYMNECKGPRGEIKDIILRAKEAGVNMKAFRELLHQHRTERQLDKRVAALEADDQESFENMVAAFGEFADTPLGRSALDRTRPRGGADEQSLNSL